LKAVEHRFGGGWAAARRLGRVVLAAVVAGLLAALAMPGSAVPESMIVIHGPSTSSHLRLTVSGEDIVVSGFLNHTGQTGCEPGGGHTIECPVAGVGGIEIDMGPQDDKVQVLDPLPIPLTVHLGAGSDKLLGNDEVDTCYSEGSKRNRCYGFGGNDVCITGQQNSDCVGGSGDDYCKHGAGSDGCWGGPGNDECIMGAGQDGCHGGPGDDRLFGGPGADQLYGGPGHDFCDGGPGIGYSHTCESGPGH
jgi:RTX calcium-binding nonapeptide repeat (4 copies)